MTDMVLIEGNAIIELVQRLDAVADEIHDIDPDHYDSAQDGLANAEHFVQQIAKDLCKLTGVPYWAL